MTFMGLILYQEQLKGFAVLFVKPNIAFCRSSCRRCLSFLSFFYKVRSCDLTGLRRQVTLILAGN